MLRIVSWNINGIRSPLQRVINEDPNTSTTMALERTLDKLNADIVCLQETKVTRDVLTEPLAIIEGYNSYFSFCRNRSGYSGVATFCKDSTTPVAAEEGLSGLLATQNGDVGCYGDMDEFTEEELRALDNEGRALLTQHKIRTQEGKEKTLTLINVYCPHVDPGKPERLAFKMHFYRLLQIRAEALLAAGSHVIILGDLNTAHRPIDHWDSVNLECFEEDPGRKWMDGLLSTPDSQAESHVGPFIDSYRCFQPKQKGAFTCWSVVTGARYLNYGSRLDYVIGDKSLVIDSFQASFLMPEIMGSDHCPVGAVLNVSSVPAKQCPPLCTRFLPEFSGTQLKIFHFLVHQKQDPAIKQSTLQLSKQSQPPSHQNKARLHSTRPRPAQVGSNRGQRNLKSYFQPSPNLECPSFNALVTPEMPGEVLVKVMKGQVKTSDSKAKDEKEVQTSFWKSVLGGPLPIPLCKGHREPCVLRTVKKPGPNLGRHFYMCARPQGHPSDPSSRCNFFLWSRPS